MTKVVDMGRWSLVASTTTNRLLSCSAKPRAGVSTAIRTPAETQARRKCAFATSIERVLWGASFMGINTACTRLHSNLHGGVGSVRPASCPLSGACAWVCCSTVRQDSRTAFKRDAQVCTLKAWYWVVHDSALEGALHPAAAHKRGCGLATLACSSWHGQVKAARSELKHSKMQMHMPKTLDPLTNTALICLACMHCTLCST